MSRPVQLKFEDEYCVGHFEDNEKKPKGVTEVIQQHRKTDNVERKKNHVWSTEETYQFYQALKIFGTDFEKIQKRLGDHITRRDVSVKFKRESRENSGMIMSAMGGKTNVRLSGILSRVKAANKSSSPNIQTRTCQVTPISSKNVSEQENTSSVYENDF
ncbi:hypothetical protein EHI8A_194470 [Entamoeba histolytica HM-1:IMSS-B]|uniref:Myb-like domain-containing protein n=8 Tax=Entamoeba TaxID=5758 RepID=C4M9F5_ENTH1|nr:hypothetical protein ENU1_163140 [Entamoeba nuttalli P19]XP_649576.1 hypothetical protein, conserved [Entamoeba histolytica HM-1:IMSS]EMD48451.1 Hypothetical protein EHI5A_090480 [Entamoeba histolytica KU27]EMH75216.1 hypothetical protein EHI8A_194470 [Entamoeba histolytica HM-1:IMSS-B]EMS11280.1 hypothetical protein KM1_270330 [Entamoeba histolytica HM-3:IMSS]ENY64603.1 hypothetical protein EHI7A_173490 [Entamoeba histolytica HM-1:IMSS-A]GAT98295.1 hypothetical protein conserved [Entamoeb|eukprot:XP_008859121.1 hypothetical protein ENU1_163140 [Entamoeba nuttalli P19]